MADLLFIYNPNRTFVSNHLDHVAKGNKHLFKKVRKKFMNGGF